MKRIITPLCLALLLAAALVFWLTPAPVQALPPGYQLNSEGDELVPIDPARVKVKPPAPQGLSQTETDQPVFKSPARLVSQAEIQLHIELDRARQAGPQAVLDFVAQQPDPSLPLLQDAVLDAQIELAPAPQSSITAPDVPHASLNFGPCVYETIQAAVNAASTGDVVRVTSGTYVELVDVSAKQITIEGGYDAACAVITGRTTIQAVAASGSVIDVTSASVLTLRNLDLTGGSSFGAGLDVLGGSNVTLDNTDIHDNNGSSGAGIYVSDGNTVTYSNNSDIYDNISSSNGGGAIVFGALNGSSNDSDIYYNSAVNGGGIAVFGGSLSLDNADVVANTASGRGGGIFATSYNNVTAVVTLTNSVFIGETAPCCQSAANGGGIYAQDSQINLTGVTVMNNTASANGGGIYLTGDDSLLTAVNTRIGYDNQAVSGNDAVLGAGMYVISATVDFQGSIMNNIASNSGGGVYANAADIAISGTEVGGLGTYQPNRIGDTGLNGGGMYLTNNTTAELDTTHIVANALANTGTGYGGGIYLRAGSALTMTNSSVESHFLPSAFDGRGAGFYIYNSTVTLNNTDVLANTASDFGGGARMFGTSTLDILNGSSFANNEALAGPGGAIAATGAPDINVSNSTFQYNTASNDGGAVYLDAGTLTFSGWWDVRWNGAGGNGGAVSATGTGNPDFSVTSGAQTSYLAVNSASGSGGAVYLTNNQTVNLYAVSGYRLNLNTNSAGGSGGALYANGGGFFDIYGNIQATSNNAGVAGGFVYLAGGSRIWLDDWYSTRPQVWVNYAPSGGAIYAADSPRVELDGVDIGGTNNGNRATAGSGGAIYLDTSTFDADNCLFRYSQATVNGGAIAAYDNSALTIHATYTAMRPASRPAETHSLLSPFSITSTGCDPLSGECSTFHNNTADSDANLNGSGGAIYLSNSSLQLDQTYLHHNTAARGGALYAINAGSVVVANNSLFHHNTSTSFYGSAIRVEDNANVTLWHATLADNTGGPAFSQTANPSITSVYNSIIYRNEQGFSIEPDNAVCNIDQDGLAGLNVAPFFVAPGASNYRLTSSSPARDACTSGLSVDLDGYPRPAWYDYDMGAYELPIMHIYLPFARKGP